MMAQDNAGRDDDDEEMNSSSARLISEPRKDGLDPADIPFCGCLSVRFYQPYFDLDTDDVTARISHAAFYCQREGNFLTLIGEKPDAYGPIWVSMFFLIKHHELPSHDIYPNLNLGQDCDHIGICSCCNFEH